MASSVDFRSNVRRCADQLASEGIGALGALFDLTSQRLVRYAVTLSRNQHDAEDAVQAALAKTAHRPQRLCAADNPWAYLLRMVRNEVLLLGRKRRRMLFLDDLRDLLTQCPVDQLEVEETHREVWSALRRLPRSQAEVVVLRVWEGMTHAQIAEVLEVSPCTVASRHRYGMQKLTHMLSAKQEELAYE